MPVGAAEQEEEKKKQRYIITYGNIQFNIGLSNPYVGVHGAWNRDSYQQQQQQSEKKIIHFRPRKNHQQKRATKK